MNLTRDEKIELLALYEEKKRREAEKQHLQAWSIMYDWQKEFVESTATHHESCLCAANQIGKSFTGSTIDAFHLLGEYPKDWKGHKFNHAPLIWVLGYSMEKTRDLIQTALFGKYEKGRGFTGGLVPASCIAGHESATGTPNAMRTVKVKHASGSESLVQFWSYSQGQHAMMGDVVDWFHVDEEPKDQTIRPQLLTRTINGDNKEGGRGIYTFTPENGRTDLVLQFMETPTASQFFMKKGWDDAPHITPEKAERMLEAYPEHQRDMRTKGEPMLGHGRIYNLSEEFIKAEPFPIPDHWFVINGMDFGWDHPQAHIQLIEDRDTETIYLTYAYKSRRTSANDAWGAVKAWSEGVPVAWPHDGLQHEKGRDNAKPQKAHYEKAGFNMLNEHSTWPEGGNSVESGIYELHDLMSKGKFKVFSGCVQFFEEYRQYHRDEKGKIVKVLDDILDAVRYAYMMRRHAIRYGDVGKSQIVKPIKFDGWGG